MVSELIGLASALGTGIGSIVNGATNAANYAEAKQKYQNEYKKYTGNAGYANSLEQAKKGAGTKAVSTGNRVTQTARGAGMSNAAAALMGGNSVADTYLNEFNTERSNAYNAGLNRMEALKNYMDYTNKQNEYNTALTGDINNVVSNGLQATGEIAKTDAAENWLKDIWNKHKAAKSSKSATSETIPNNLTTGVENTIDYGYESELE